MLNPKVEELFYNNILPQEIIKGFPYPERYCPYCNSKLDIARVIHLVGEEEHYKALLVCNNESCSYFDLKVQKSYLLIYFSSQHARDILERALMAVPRLEIK